MHSRTLGIAMLALAGLATLSGCIIVSRNDSSLVDGWSGPGETRTLTVPHVAGSRLDVRTRNGSIEVRQGGVDEVTITATIRARSQDRLSRTTFLAKRDAEGTLEVRVEWPDGPRGNEGASIVVVTPAAAKVSALASNGDIRVHLDDCRVDVENSNGDIVANTSGAIVKAASSNGKVDLQGVAGARVGTSNDRVRVAMAADATGPVDIRTSNASVDLSVGPAFGECSARPLPMPACASMCRVPRFGMAGRSSVRTPLRSS